MWSIKEYFAQRRRIHKPPRSALLWHDRFVYRSEKGRLAVKIPAVLRHRSHRCDAATPEDEEGDRAERGVTKKRDCEKYNASANKRNKVRGSDRGGRRRNKKKKRIKEEVGEKKEKNRNDKKTRTRCRREEGNERASERAEKKLCERKKTRDHGAPPQVHEQHGRWGTDWWRPATMPTSSWRPRFTHLDSNSTVFAPIGPYGTPPLETVAAHPTLLFPPIPTHSFPFYFTLRIMLFLSLFSLSQPLPLPFPFLNFLVFVVFLFVFLSLVVSSYLSVSLSFLKESPPSPLSPTRYTGHATIHAQRTHTCLCCVCSRTM